MASKKSLFDHVISTYITLRYGMVLIGIALPLVVWQWGEIGYGIPLQPTMSDYYWASPTQPPAGDSSIFDQQAPSRVWLVGGIFAIAACLWAYKGFSRWENFILNFAALFAVGVAIFPTCNPALADCGKYSLHGFCAIAMFVCLFSAALFHNHHSLKYLPEKEQGRFKTLYGLIGLGLLLVPLSAFVLNSFVGAEGSFIFWVEAGAIWLFAAYWYTKIQEFRRSKLTTRVLRGEIKEALGQEKPEREAAPATAFGRAAQAAQAAASMVFPGE